MAKIILLLIFSFFSATSCNEKNEDKTSNYQSLENNPPPIVKDVKSSKNIELKKEKLVAASFELCEFVNCDFSEADLADSKFIECSFTNCNYN